MFKPVRSDFTNLGLLPFPTEIVVYVVPTAGFAALQCVRSCDVHTQQKFETCTSHPCLQKKLYRYSPIGKTYKRGQNGFSQENTVGASKHGTCQFAYHKAWNLSRPRQEQTKYASQQWMVDVMSAGTWRLHGKHEALIPKPKPITLNIPYL